MEERDAYLFENPIQGTRWRIIDLARSHTYVQKPESLHTPFVTATSACYRCIHEERASRQTDVPRASESIVC